jgi:hypothetical protein
MSADTYAENVTRIAREREQAALAAINALMEVVELVPHPHLPHQWLDAHRAGREARKLLGDA